jgi:CheY-like chemotaxis protein
MARILVVDDQPDVARSIARMLYDHDTVTETDPERGVARVVSGERFEIVLVDLNMPVMSGREVSDAITRAQLARPPIVLMMSSGEHVDSLFATGRAVLIKPFEGDELRDLIAAMLHEDRPGRRSHPPE